MSNRSQRAKTAQQTVEILATGSYQVDGAVVSIAAELRAAVEGTVVFTPDRCAALVASLQDTTAPQQPACHVEVRNCTTFAAASSLVVGEQRADTLCLNFASAKNPGGGFLNGSQAQEEALSRASGLYACIAPQQDYYLANRAEKSCLYTHHLIYSPGVPVFRNDRDTLLAHPYRTAIVTSPAVNAGVVRQKERANAEQVNSVLRARMAQILAVAAHHGHRNLVLGAWGCGVFRNDPVDVAAGFAAELQRPSLRHRFDKIVFAVLDKPAGRAITAFENQFGRSDGQEAEHEHR